MSRVDVQQLKHPPKKYWNQSHLKPPCGTVKWKGELLTEPEVVKRLTLPDLGGGGGEVKPPPKGFSLMTFGRDKISKHLPNFD